MRGKVIDLAKPHLVGGIYHVMTVAERALRMVGDYITYHLAYPNGGADPEDSHPEDEDTSYCDCIGFAAWCAGFDRYQPKKFPLYDGYINTDSMIAEATGSASELKKLGGNRGGRWFTVLEKPEPGCFVVAASYFSKLRLKRIIGHIGVVVDASEWATKGLAGLQVVHCSSSNAKRPGNKRGSAVWKTDGTVWKGYPTVYFIKFNREYAMQLSQAK